MADPTIFPARGEADHLGRAVEARRRQFAAGRAAARDALARIGGPAGIIPARPEGDPQWPAGFVGSITHTDAWALAVVARAETVAALGVDLEPATPLEADLFALVCRPEERGPGLGVPAQGIDPGKLRFVAKEAYYKAVYPVTRRFLEFQDVRVQLGAGPGAFHAAVVDAGGLPMPRSVQGGAYLCHAELLCGVCWGLPPRLESGAPLV